MSESGSARDEPLIVSPRTRRLSPARAEKYRGERDGIVAAAYRFIGATASQNTSVSDILREAGVSTRAFYRYFASKDDLILYMFRADSGRVAVALDAAVARADTPLRALEAWTDEMLAIAYDAHAPWRAHHFATLTSNEAAGAVGYDEALAEALARQRASLVRLLRDGQEAGVFPFADPELDAFAIQCVVVGHMRAKVLGQPGPSRARIRQHVVSLVTRALGASPAEADGRGRPRGQR